MFPTASGAFILNHSSLSRRVLGGGAAIGVLYRTGIYFIPCFHEFARNCDINDTLIYYNRFGEPIKAPPLLVDYCIKYFYLAIPSATSSLLFETATCLRLLLCETSLSNILHFGRCFRDKK